MRMQRPLKTDSNLEELQGHLGHEVGLGSLHRMAEGICTFVRTCIGGEEDAISQGADNQDMLGEVWEEWQTHGSGSFWPKS